MPKRKPPPDGQHRIDHVLRSIFGAEGNTPIVIDMSDSIPRRQQFVLTLTEHQRHSLVEFCNLSTRQKKKLESVGNGKQPVTVTRKELGELHDKIGEFSQHAPAAHKKRLDSVYKQVAKLFEKDDVATLARHNKKTSRAKQPTNTIYQFKITLLDTKPKIWRRIQIPDCKVNTLHFHIQAVMGWTNSHLHHFEIKGERYGIPEHIDYSGDGSVVDSRRIMVSEIVPPDGKKIAFRYTYDFGDNWEHEVLFEGIVEPDPKTKYPVCIEGERAGPPEDCGGTPGYEQLLAVLADPRHEEHRDMLEWVGKDFNPELFDARIATVRMVRGLRG